jgi:hypothetical protein
METLLQRSVTRIDSTINYFSNIKHFKILEAYTRACSHEQQCMYLMKFDVPDAHYLKTHSIRWHAIHVLCIVHTLVLLVVLLQREDCEYWSAVSKGIVN